MSGPGERREAQGTANTKDGDSVAPHSSAAITHASAKSKPHQKSHDPHHRHHVVHAHDHALAAKFAAGGISCMVSSAVLNPMDVIKVRFQLQNQLVKMTSLVNHTGQYDSFAHAFVKIYKEEGFFRGLMKGFTPSMLREASYSSLRMGLYDFFKGIIAPDVKHKHDFTLFQKIFAGACSGALGSAIANPTDLIKIRFQAVTPQNPNPYKHTVDAMVSIYKNEHGLRGLYRGVWPTTIRASVLTAAQLSSYDHTKKGIVKYTSLAPDSVSTHLLASVVSGFVTATATNPVDVLKTRVMAEGDRGLYKGPWDCFVKTVQKEGPQALLKGWLPNYLRLGPHSVISLSLFEFVRKYLGADPM